MSDRKKIIFSSIAILSTVSVVVAAFVFWILYEAAFDQERKRLIDAVRGQARILESIASFDENMVAESSAAAVMQVRDAYSRHITFGRTGEVLFARREGDSMVFLLRHFGPTVDKPESIPFSSQTAEPMRRALSGESGWVIGIDYRGEPVLSAYEPVEALGIGIVAKTDISEIRAPFIQAGIRAGALSFAVIVLGSLLILSTSSPIIRRVEKSECTLKESEYFSAKMLESSISGLYILDFRQAEKIYISPAYTRITGHSPGDPYKMEEFYSSFHPDDLPRVIEHMDLMRQASDEDILEIEYRFKAADGRWLWCLSRNAVFERDEAGSVRQIIGSFLDITERRNAEASLRESEARYRELVENANSAIIRWRSDGTVTFFNEYAQAFFGYTESEIIGRHVGILVPERESSGTDLTMLVKDIVTHPERYLQNVNENIRRDGTRVWM
ncbi:MAG: PAS domain S-box protein, partial [Syntrophobacteraceae bacterium]